MPSPLPGQSPAQLTQTAGEIHSDKRSKRVSAWTSLPIQFFGGGALLGTLLSMLSLFSSGDLYDGLLTLVGAAIVGATIAVPAMIIGTIVGLPLRIFSALRRWWMSTGSIVALALATAGMAGIILSYLIGTDVFVPSDLAGASVGYVRDPAPIWYYGSVIIAAIGLCHIVFPLPKRRR